MLGEFLGNLQTVAVQVVILYLIAFVGFFADKSKIFVRADATKLVDLIFNSTRGYFCSSFFYPEKNTYKSWFCLGFSGCSCSMWKFPGQGLNPCHSYCGDNAGSLTHCATGELLNLLSYF